ncbi:MAG: thermonuclease family protein [Candidatus Humimicrobiia bacterium]
MKRKRKVPIIIKLSLLVFIITFFIIFCGYIFSNSIGDISFIDKIFTNFKNTSAEAVKDILEAKRILDSNIFIDEDISALPRDFEALVHYVYDGDTIRVVIDNKEYDVRYIGINTPEIDHSPDSPSEYYGYEAKEYNKQLVDKKYVYLAKDVSETDKYGRLLRYVWTDTYNMINAVLVRDGYANVMTIPPDVKYSDRFLEALAIYKVDKQVQILILIFIAINLL